MGDSYRLVRNIFYNFLSQAWFLVFGFATTPYIVRRLGNDAYGVLALVTAVLGYFAFLNFGFGPAVIRYAAEFHAKKDHRGLSKLIGTALAFFLLVGSAGGLLIFLTTSFIIGLLPGVPHQLLREVHVVFWISAVGFFVNMPLSVFSALPRALQRFDVSNRIDLLLGTVSITLTVLLLYLGYGLVQLALLNITMSAVALAVFMAVSKKFLPEVSFRPAFDSGMFRELFHYGGAILLTQVTGNIIFQLDKLIIGFFQPIAALTFYSVPFNLSQKLLTIPSILNPVIFPAASEKLALERHDLVEEIYVRGTRLVMVLVLPAAVVMACYSPQLMKYWLGDEFALKSAFVLRFLSASFFLAALTTIPTTVAQAMGRPAFPAKFALLLAGLQACFILSLVPAFGIKGAAVSLFAAHAIFVPYYIYSVHKKVLTVPFGTLLEKAYLKPVLLAPLSLGLCMAGAPFINGLARLIAGALLVVLIVYGAAYVFIMDGREKAMLSGYFLKAGKVRA
jgi:O-antigen/teichoic acid export membrane protein